jgi:hypothetical protein|tara:strand:+ start:121 stop:351 length:231 start_codon:yes stop_codon:yes gene_type:complete
LSEESQKLPQENSDSKDSGEMKEISLVLRHTELDSEDYIAITIKSKTESIDELILKAKNAFPKNMKKNQNLMDPIN